MDAIYPCPVCGFLHEEEPWGKNSTGSQEICPSCGVQFGYTDYAGGDEAKRRQIYHRWNQVWIENGRIPLNADQTKRLLAEIL